MNLRQGAGAVQDCPPDVPGCGPPAGGGGGGSTCPEDVDGDGLVNGEQFASLLGFFNM